MNFYIAIMSRKDGGTRIQFPAASLESARQIMAVRYPGVAFTWIGAQPTLKGKAGQSMLPR